jgi:hypothetical protein
VAFEFSEVSKGYYVPKFYQPVIRTGCGQSVAEIEETEDGSSMAGVETGGVFYLLNIKRASRIDGSNTFL